MPLHLSLIERPTVSLYFTLQPDLPGNVKHEPVEGKDEPVDDIFHPNSE
jgi:hypothetical protein